MKISIYSFLSFCLILLGLKTQSLAQTYLTAAGIRVGNGIGLTVNQRILDKVTVEGILQNDYKTKTYLHVLGKVHNNLISRRMNMYYGGGVHIGFQNGDQTTGSSSTGIAGVDGILGAEFTVGRINISGDFKPHYTSGGNGFGLNGGVSVRYVIVKDNAIKKIKRNQQKKRKKRQKAKSKSEKKFDLKEIFDFKKKN
ncbi:MAG: hypothetical protein KDE26_01970 [Bacteroidetes bacterium]|nr:hypothetical protein [Bacteroidota bacterium]MCB0842012.1 hypothetical protein [Bacteroidota bacterium]